MSFSWLDRKPPRTDGAARRAEVACAELASRAGLLYRLGYTADVATQRLCERAAWEYEGGRPDALSDQAIAKIVKDTFARRPG
jgi:hypothetical protein